MTRKSNYYLQIVPPGYEGSAGLGSEEQVKVVAAEGGFEQGHSNRRSVMSTSQLLPERQVATTILDPHVKKHSSESTATVLL